MKQLTCEMCGGTDLLKKEGVFVCQSCGTKYSVEEAKKMMVEGVVEVKGTVEVDESSKIENFLIMAQNAYEASNSKEAEEYCNRIIEIDPTSYKAWLIKGKAAGWQSTMANTRIEEAKNCFEKAIQNAPPEALNEVTTGAYEALSNLGLAMFKLHLNMFKSLPNDKNLADVNSATLIYGVGIFTSTFLAYVARFSEYNKAVENEEDKIEEISFIELSEALSHEIDKAKYFAAISIWNEAIDEYNKSDDGHPNKYDCQRMMEKSSKAILFIELLVHKKDIKEHRKGFIVKACKEAIKMLTTYMDLKYYEMDFSDGVKGYRLAGSINEETKNDCIAKINKLHEKIKELDPDYEIPAVAPPPPAQSGGCYIATAIYGSYDCPEVWVLRRYRDDTLAATWYGRAFIRTYYTLSPTLVRCFGKNTWFKYAGKVKLEKLVSKLQSRGVENTSYSDKAL